MPGLFSYIFILFAVYDPLITIFTPFDKGGAYAQVLQDRIGSSGGGTE